MTDKRPNILFAFADDWGRYASAYRQVEGDSTPNALLNTPNFDRVAGEGALFTNAFVPAPSCTGVETPTGTNDLITACVCRGSYVP